MEILLTGRLREVTAAACDHLAERYKVVAASGDLDTGLIGRKVTPFKLSPHDEDFEKVFNSYNFDTAVFFSQRPEELREDYNEFQDLEACLRLCSEHDVNKVVYLSSTGVYAGLASADEDTRVSPGDCLGVMLAACENLCEFYRRQKAMSVIVVHAPCLFGYGEGVSLVGNAIAQAVDSASLKLQGPENQLCDFLSEKDLAELLIRLIDGWSTQHTVINVPGASSMTLGQLGELIKLRYPTLRLSYSERALPAAPPLASQIPRKEYDWVPVHDLQEELNQLIHDFSGDPVAEKVPFWTRVKEFWSEHSFLIRLVELVLGFLLMEFLNYITETSVQFQYIDFRLLYVTLLGTLHGIRTGFAAAVLACLSLLIAYVNSDNAWFIIAYNVDSWLPFVGYLVLGTVTGYVKDRMRNDNKFLAEEKSILEDKYILLNEFYVSALQNKGQYKTQIMSYRDSFGRIFDVTRKLDHTVAEAVINEALHALEDVLENQSICIYTCDEYVRFGRLVACSKKISAITEKSLMLSKLDRMVGEFEDGEVWVNKDRLPGYPEYAAPIFRGDKPVTLVVIQKVKYEQMAMYYENLIKVLCGLLKISLLRALEYTEKIEDEIYLPGTRIMQPEYFKKIIGVKEDMSEDGVSEYALIRIDTTPDNLTSVGEALLKSLRVTDVLGLGVDGELYICLSQANENNINIVLSRIQAAGLTFRNMNGGEG